MAVNIRRHFNVDQNRSYKLAMLLEAAQCGDAVQNAMWPLVDQGDLAETLAQLSRIHNQLGTAIEDIAVAFSALEKRPQLPATAEQWLAAYQAE
jgi:hypothetical protein